jgi:hypothetical protein
MTKDEMARVQLSRASLVDALYQAAKTVARLTDAEFVTIENALRECIEVLQVRVLPPIAGRSLTIAGRSLTTG